MKTIQGIVKGEATTVVNNDNTAISAQSGSLPVFATPCMIALMEKATCAAVNDLLDEGETTVGTKIDVAHSKASGLNTAIRATAVLKEVDGRRLVFSVSASDDSGSEIGNGCIERFVVISDKFMKRVEAE